MIHIANHYAKNLAFIICVLLTAPAVLAARTDYNIDYHVHFVPKQNAATVSMDVRPDSGRAKRFIFNMPEDQYQKISGEGVEVDGDKVTWNVPDAGGELRYTYGPVNQARKNRSFDAHMTEDWAILRGDDLFPAAKVLQTKGADSRTRLRFTLPDGWTFVDTGYSRSNNGESFVVTNSERSFDRPVGWIIAGKIGSRRENISGVELSVAAPRGSNATRTEIMAFCAWILPEMDSAFGDLPNKILVVSADDPMWRGGLSSPNSFYMHSSRPLISGNYTSTLIHELVHIITGIRDKEGFDWITEGLAEFYSAELLRRSGGMTDDRFGKVMEFMADWGKDIKTLRAKNSTGPRTAKAVLFFNELDTEIKQRTKGDKNLDAVVRLLMKQGKVDLDDLRDVSEKVAGGPLKAFGSPLLK